MKLILSKEDLFRLSEPTRAEILDYLGSPAAVERHTVENPDRDYDGIDMSYVADLTYRQVRIWMQAASNWTKAGLRVFAEQGPVIHVNALVEALKKEGSDKYSQFQSRTTVRTRTVTGNKELFLLGWDEWEGGEGRYAVTRQTYKSLRRYFNLDKGDAS